jgi:phosphate-selective porin OprO/OprP
MKLTKLTVALATFMGAIASADALAIDLYVDTKTNQIYAAPGRGRVLMGSFVKVGDAAQNAASATPAQTAELTKIRDDLALKDNQIKALEEHAVEASKQPEIKLNDGIEFATKDGNFKASINGRMQVDAQVNTNNDVNPTALATNGANAVPGGLNDGAGIRRARLGVEGTMFKSWGYKFEYDFTRGNGTVAAGVTDAYIRYDINKPFSVKVGSFKEPFSLEEATSNRFITFLERNMAVNTFVDNPNTYKVGLGANYAAERWNLATSLQTEPVGANGASNSSVNTNGGSNRNNGSGDTSWEFNGRVAGLPWKESNTKFLHIGASGSFIDVNNQYTNSGGFNNGGFSFVSALNNNVDRTNILNTGNLTYGALNGKTSHQINNFNRWGAESALVYGPFSAQAEYIQTNIYGRGYNGNSLYGFYTYATYFLTGESRAYKGKTAAWDRIKPTKNFDWKKGSWGAWEVAAGYDTLDLNAGDVRGGRASTFKVGLNWYPNSHIRIMSNFIHILTLNTQGSTNASATDLTSVGFNNASLDVFEMRTQVDF